MFHQILSEYAMSMDSLLNFGLATPVGSPTATATGHFQQIANVTCDIANVDLYGKCR